MNTRAQRIITGNERADVIYYQRISKQFTSTTIILEYKLKQRF